jgi:hypothetical protein
VSGTWRELEHAWHDTNVEHCAVCGKLIPRRAWCFDGAAGEVVACSPACEELYETYWLPTHGAMNGGRA